MFWAHDLRPRQNHEECAFLDGDHVTTLGASMGLSNADFIAGALSKDRVIVPPAVNGQRGTRRHLPVSPRVVDVLSNECGRCESWSWMERLVGRGRGGIGIRGGGL